jgi:mono/diheme cytochrome c family protein
MTQVQLLQTIGLIVLGVGGVLLLFVQARFLRVAAFVAIVLGAFSLVALSIPQMESVLPAMEKFDVASIKDKKDLAAIGQKIFFGKGQCALCHTIGTSEGRCPDLKGIGGKLTRQFIYESLTQPQAYIYKDYEVSDGPPKFFPAKMPYINKKPIGLNNNEILAVIAFLQSMSGEEITVDPSEIEAPREVVQAIGDKTAGQKAFQSLCAKCHSIGGEKGNLVPVLTKYNDAALRHAVLTAPKPGSKVHQGLEKLPVKEFDDLMAYLQDVKATRKTTVTEGSPVPGVLSEARNVDPSRSLS